jgi:DNA-binding transcriptional ArsR family regulator
MTNDANRPTESLTPVPTQPLTTEEEIRAYVHPTRMAILAMLAEEKQTVSGIARRLGVHPANLTHHFKLLEKVGLIKLVEKRDTGKNLEKYYRAMAHNFTVNPFKKMAAKAVRQHPSQGALALSILRDNLATAVQTLESREDDPPVFGFIETARLRPEDVAEFQKRFMNMLEEFGATLSDTGTVYHLNISLYPGETDFVPTQEVRIEGDQ